MMERTEVEIREAILEEAKSWLGTPFHDDARIKGVGVDCAQFVAACYLASGAVDHFEIPHYTSQWFLHNDEEKLRDFVLRFGKQIDEEAVKPGDLVLFKIGRAFGHAAIIVDWPNMIIHAHMLSRMVTFAKPMELDLRIVKEKQFFSVWG